MCSRMIGLAVVSVRVKTKEISEVINEKLIRAEQELKSASSILNITSTGLNLEELNKAKTIANSSESEFIAFDQLAAFAIQPVG